jgi:hypothetical protein
MADPRFELFVINESYSDFAQNLQNYQTPTDLHARYVAVRQAIEDAAAQNRTPTNILLRILDSFRTSIHNYIRLYNATENINNSQVRGFSAELINDYNARIIDGLTEEYNNQLCLTISNIIRWMQNQDEDYPIFQEIHFDTDQDTQDVVVDTINEDIPQDRWENTRRIVREAFTRIEPLSPIIEDEGDEGDEGERDEGERDEGKYDGDTTDDDDQYLELAQALQSRRIRSRDEEDEDEDERRVRQRRGGSKYYNLLRNRFEGNGTAMSRMSRMLDRRRHETHETRIEEELEYTYELIDQVKFFKNMLAKSLQEIQKIDAKKNELTSMINVFREQDPDRVYVDPEIDIEMTVGEMIDFAHEEQNKLLARRIQEKTKSDGFAAELQIIIGDLQRQEKRLINTSVRYTAIPADMTQLIQPYLEDPSVKESQELIRRFNAYTGGSKRQKQKIIDNLKRIMEYLK